jgi:hypothetical protein
MDTSESQDSKKSELPSQGTISIDFNDCSSSDQELNPPEPPTKLIEGDSGPITIGPRKRFFQRDTSSQSSDSSSAKSSTEVGSLEKAFLEVDVRDNRGRGLACTCAKQRRLDVKEIQAQAKSVQDKITRLLRESRVLMNTIRRVMNDSP